MESAEQSIYIFSEYLAHVQLQGSVVFHGIQQLGVDDDQRLDVGEYF
jgi:hypothetical protein